MARLNPNSERQQTKRLSQQLGIPEGVLRFRAAKGLPLDAPYVERRKGAELVAWKAAIEQAKSKGEKKFEFRPCDKCQCRTYYVTSRACVDCVNERASQWWASKKK